MRLHWSKAAGAVKNVVVFAPASYCCISLLYILMVPYAIKSSCENSSHRFACAILQDIHRKLSVFLHKRQPDRQCHQPQAGCPDLTSRWMSLDTFDVRSSSSDATGCLERLALVLLCLHPRAPKRKKNGHMTHMNMSPNVSNAKFAKIQAQDQAFRFRVHRGC